MDDKSETTNSIPTAEEILNKLSQLSPIEQGLYYFMFDDCWMTEKNMAKALKTHQRAISTAKKVLEAAGLIHIIRETNKPNRPNDIHRILKVEYTGLLPILEECVWVLKERELVLSNRSTENQLITENQSIENINIFPDSTPLVNLTSGSTIEVSLNWNLLTSYTAAEINAMPKLEQVELYMEVGLLVLPTHYPIFKESNQVLCSCNNEYCHAIGKHPFVKKFRSLTPEDYQEKRKGYMQRFKENPDLNIGFKPCGYSIVDVDFNKGGAFALEILCEEANGLDETLTVKSANGIHLYSSTVGLHQSVSLLGEGLDIRSDKTTGFIVAPCSMHKTGKHYEWYSINELQPIPDEWFEETEPELSKPEKITKKSVSKKTGRTRKEVEIPRWITDDYFIPEGERAVTLFKFACRERGRGAGKQQIYNVLVNIRDNNCEKSKDSKDNITNAQMEDIARYVVRKYPTNAEKLALQKAS
jgi:hypothetical protein